MLTLDGVKEGEKIKIREIIGGRGMRQRLCELGVIPGSTVEVIKNALFGGPILLKTDGGEVAVGRGIAKRIIVEAVS